MPDHVHLLVRGGSPDVSLQRFVHQAKQLSAHAYRSIRRQPLWQRGYHDRVLRPHTPLADVIRYIVQNPVRAGLVENADKYRFSGISDSVPGDIRVAAGL
jgi:REP element-mobilizing transposase RayT